jgi:hypothetical protein
MCQMIYGVVLSNPVNLRFGALSRSRFFQRWAGTKAVARFSVKGGVKIDRPGGEKVDHFLGSGSFVLKDLRGWLERRPATRFTGRA